VKDAKGNPGRRPISEEAREAEKGAGGAGSAAMPSEGGGGGDHSALPTIAPPEWLRPEAVEIWKRIAPRLTVIRILQVADADTFGRYCEDFAKWIGLNAILREEGMTYQSESPHGKYTRAHPALAMADRLNRTLLMFEANFGLNPADRQRLFAARAAGAGSGACAELPFGSEGDGGDADDKPKDAPESASPVGMLN
jgi:P27 family predicted phage terminase small subunit